MRTCAATRSASRSAVSAVAVLRARVPAPPEPTAHGGSHSATRVGPRGEASSATTATGEPTSRAAAAPGSDGGGGGRDEHRVGTVAGCHPAQASQYRGDVGAEDAPVGVALVHHDVAQRAQERSPRRVPREHRPVEQVRVGQHVRRMRPDPRPLLPGGVAVVGRRPQPGQCQLVQRPQLVVRQRLGGGQVQHGGRAPIRCGRPGQDRRQRGQPERQRLPGRGAGGEHDMASGVGQLGGLGLVLPRQRDSPGLQGLDQRRGHPGRPRGRTARPGRTLLQVPQPGPTGRLPRAGRRGGTQPREDPPRCGRLCHSGPATGRGPAPAGPRW